MRIYVLILIFLISMPVLSQNVVIAQVIAEDKGILIRDITIEGFVLQDKNQFVRLFKPYKNKHLKTADMDAILLKIQDIYQQEGYQQLVTINYKVVKRHLIFTALMTS